MAAVESNEWARQNMIPAFPLGIFRDKTAEQED
jgi:hypothetical protein